MMCEDPKVHKLQKKNKQNDGSSTLLGELKKHLKGRNYINFMR